MTYAGGSIKKFVEDLSSKTPAPGGGSVAALALACGAGLLAMACRYTLGKKTYREFSVRCRLILKRSLEIRRQALGLMDADIKAYLSKDAEQSIAVPAKVCRLSVEVLRGADEVVGKGSVYLKSDARLAASLACAALAASFSYVRINLLCLKREGKNEKLIHELKTRARSVKKLMKAYGENSWPF
ncbi:MAG: cyclodeaminase/cyclohydrolase family protein [Candidatus Omnitrophota bacterium]